MQHPYAHLARELRRNATTPEKYLWHWLRRRPLGFKFRRQVPLGPYIVDFACFEARLAVELDGDFHAEQPEDLDRDAQLQAWGWEVARYWNRDLRCDPLSVQLDVERRLSARLGRDVPAWYHPTPALVRVGWGRGTAAADEPPTS